MLDNISVQLVFRAYNTAVYGYSEMHRTCFVSSMQRMFSPKKLFSVFLIHLCLGFAHSFLLLCFWYNIFVLFC